MLTGLDGTDADDALIREAKAEKSFKIDQRYKELFK